MFFCLFQSVPCMSGERVISLWSSKHEGNTTKGTLQQTDSQIKHWFTPIHLVSYNALFLLCFFTCISLLLLRLPKLPSQDYSNGPGNLGTLGTIKKHSLCHKNVTALLWFSIYPKVLILPSFLLGTQRSAHGVLGMFSSGFTSSPNSLVLAANLVFSAFSIRLFQKINTLSAM